MKDSEEGGDGGLEATEETEDSKGPGYGRGYMKDSDKKSRGVDEGSGGFPG